MCLLVFLLALVHFTYSQENITIQIRRYGYPVEVHTALTPDFYELIIHRLPHGRSNNKATKGPVFLQHGLTDASATWAMNNATEGLAYILADLGYDVWLGNNRGNGYSMGNTKYPPDSKEFWDFSWDEMAQYDLPTQIKYVLGVTGKSKLSYVGHSQGTTQAFAAFCSDPQLASMFNVYIALAPVTFAGNLRVELLKLLADLDAYKLLELLGLTEFYLPNFMHEFLPFVCDRDPNACAFGSEWFYGPWHYYNVSRTDVYFAYEPFPTSAKNVIHWAQSIQTGKFQKYDYGTAGNMQHYNQPTPPQYELSNFPTNLPTVLYWGGNDGLADPIDVQLLIQKLPKNNVKVFEQTDFGHMDYPLGYMSWKLLYPSIIQQLGMYN